MIFDELGLPRDTGATDLQDSARLAGVMTVFGWPQKVELNKYVVGTSKMVYMRHPSEYKYDFSRDQAICLMAGLFVQDAKILVSKNFIKGNDWFSPSHNGHVRICQGLKPRWYQNLWLWFDVCYNIWVTPMSEPNQLLCMLMVHPNKKYLKFWLKRHGSWRETISNYWCGWRKEYELALHMIGVLEKV